MFGPESLLPVGKAVVTRAVSTWLADRTKRTERTLPLSELIDRRATDFLTRRDLHRRIEAMTDTVADRLTPLCEGDLPDNEREAALTAVAATFDAADLSDQALFATNAEPFALARAVRAALPDATTRAALSEPATRLYDLVIDECCACLVQLTVHLPSFQPRALAEMLQRLAKLSDDYAALLARLPKPTLDAPTGTDLDEDFTARYRQFVSDTWDDIELFGVDVHHYRPRSTLSVAYIGLSVSPQPSDRMRQPELDPGSSRLARTRPDQNAGQASIETALGQSRRMLLRGGAGSGKTTLLRWLGVSAARSTFQGPLEKWNGRIPVLIRLRGHANRLPQPSEFISDAAEIIVNISPPGWVHRQLLSGRALLLIDGVDELPSSQRRTVRPWLQSLTAAYPEISIVVTSRPAAVTERWLTEEGFATADLEPMTPADVRGLIQHWHLAIADAGNLPCSPKELPRYETELLRRMDSSPHLRALATTPLLCAVLCALNLDRRTHLPLDRLSVYDDAITMLLERRDAERGIAAELDMALGARDKLHLLQHLAWQFSTTARSELRQDVVASHLARKMGTMPTVRANPEQLLKHLLERSGVLRSPVPGRVDFVHRTFQEYLTAREAAELGDTELLVDRAHLDPWHETVVLATGLLNAPKRAELVTALLNRASIDSADTRHLTLLAAACLETAPSLPDHIRERLDVALATLLPPRRSLECQSLAAVGPPLLARLPRSTEDMSTSSAVATIRTISLINGPEAIELLADYANDDRSGVQDALVDAWQYFDPEDYAQRVLAEAPLRNGSCTLKNATLLTASRHLHRLTSLSFDADQLDSLEPLLGAKHLTEVTIQDGLVSDLAPLTKLPPLSALFLNTNTAVSNLTAIRSQPSLEILSLFTEGIISELGFLADLSNLRILGLQRIRKKVDMTPLARFSGLQSLALPRSAGLGDLHWLRSMQDLQILDLADSRWDDGLAAIVGMPALRRLLLDGCSWIDDFDALVSLPRLTALGLSRTHIRDLSPLTRLDQLRVLRLNLCSEVVDLSPLRTLTKLAELRLSDCHAVSDLSPLADLPNLRFLDISGIAPGADLSPFAGRRLTVEMRSDQHVRGQELLVATQFR